MKNKKDLYRVCYFQDKEIVKEYPLTWESSWVRKIYLEKIVIGYVWFEKLK